MKWMKYADRKADHLFDQPRLSQRYLFKANAPPQEVDDDDATWLLVHHPDIVTQVEEPAVSEPLSAPKRQKKGESATE